MILLTYNVISKVTSFIGNELPYIGVVVGLGYGYYLVTKNKNRIKEEMNISDQMITVSLIGIPVFAGYLGPIICHRIITSPILHLTIGVYLVSNLIIHMDTESDFLYLGQFTSYMKGYITQNPYQVSSPNTFQFPYWMPNENRSLENGIEYGLKKYLDYDTEYYDAISDSE